MKRTTRRRPLDRSNSRRSAVLGSMQSDCTHCRAGRLLGRSKQARRMAAQRSAGADETDHAPPLREEEALHRDRECCSTSTAGRRAGVWCRWQQAGAMRIGPRNVQREQMGQQQVQQQA